MADAEVASRFTGISVRLRCPRCRALLDISRIDVRKRFACGGCNLNTDAADCVAATEGFKLRPGVRLAAGFIPAAFSSFFFVFVEALLATGFSFWGEAALAALTGGALCGLCALVVRGLSISRDAPRAASRVALAGVTMALGPWLRWRAGGGAVTDTMMAGLEYVALFWLCVAIYNIFRVFRPGEAKQVAQVVEVDNLRP